MQISADGKDKQFCIGIERECFLMYRMAKKRNPLKNTRKAPDETVAEHLRPHLWQPGQSGNPNGRPRNKTPTEMANEMLRAEFDPLPDAIKRLQESMPPAYQRKPTLQPIEIILWIWIRRAMTVEGDTARRNLLDRIEGKPMMRIESTIEEKSENPISLADFSEDELRILQALAMQAMQRKLGSNGTDGR